MMNFVKNKGEELIIVGNGMVGAKFCEELVARKMHKRMRVTVFGKESRVAYNRVKLSTYMSHRDDKQLELNPVTWYRRHGIELFLSDPVAEIQVNDGCVVSKSGRRIWYDHLVLATGSYPFVPPIQGTEQSGVFVYRTIDDLEAILGYCYYRKSAIVIGGGLLGLEAAEAVQNLGMEVHVVELAASLMPQQLTPRAGGALRRQLDNQGIHIHLHKISERIVSRAGKKIVYFRSGESLSADTVIISTGIRPNSSLAESSGIACGPSGGIVVNDRMETNCKNIYAIGECALHRGQIYGLVGPGYRMAKLLADRLDSGNIELFEKADMSTRLKMLGVNVINMGEHLQPGTITEYENDSEYRYLVTDQNRLIGALGVGAWDESGRLQSSFDQGLSLSEAQLKQFHETGYVWPQDEKVGVETWSDDTYVCNCLQIPKGEICQSIARGTAELEDLVKETKAATVCGSCRPLLAQLLGTPMGELIQKGWKPLLIVSLVALIAGVIQVLMPGVSMSDSVESQRYQWESLWRNKFYKQLTGYILLGISAVGLLLSLRKRWNWFSFGNFRYWRVFHGLFGMVSLIVLFAHTGFHFGHNLNFVLMFVFVVLNLIGAIAGMVAALESRGKGKWSEYARKFRPVLTYMHIVFFWPLPVLIAFHIMSVYFY